MAYVLCVLSSVACQTSSKFWHKYKNLMNSHLANFDMHTHVFVPPCVFTGKRTHKLLQVADGSCEAPEYVKCGFMAGVLDLRRGRSIAMQQAESNACISQLFYHASRQAEDGRTVQAVGRASSCLT
eukprot:1404438-Pleurochrysis_carterae.AAC.7